MARNKEFVTCKQVAHELGLTPDYVCRLVRSGKIKGKKLANNWLIDPNGYKKIVRTRFPRDKDVKNGRSKHRNAEHS